MGKKITKKDIDENQYIFTTEKINDIIKRENLGQPIKRFEKIWFNGNPGVRKQGITFAMTGDEITEYVKCKLSVHYFAEKYCQIKREDGSIGPMTLRDYQKEIISLYDENRFSILMASRQVGKCISFFTKVKIQYENGDIIEKSIGELYFEQLKLERKLTFLERIKYFLYRKYNKYV